MSVGPPVVGVSSQRCGVSRLGPVRLVTGARGGEGYAPCWSRTPCGTGSHSCGSEDRKSWMWSSITKPY